MDEIIGPTICDTTQVSNPVSLTVINVLLIWYTFASLPYIYNNKQFWTDYLFQMILSLILSIICYRIINIPSSFGYAICINDWESVNNYCNYHNYSKYPNDSELVNQTSMWTDKGRYPDYCRIPMFCTKLFQIMLGF